MLKILEKVLKLSKPREIRVSKKYCPICETATLFIKLNSNEMAIRCFSCKASIVSLSIADVISQKYSDINNLFIYELSTRGPLFKYLDKKCNNLTTSEYFPGIESGHFHNGILCQDVQKLSFENNSFDLCTATDVFEHVPNDLAGFLNIYRVLKPGGIVIFTVPLSNGKTVQRAKIRSDGQIEYLLPPEYHGDPNSESGQILAFRNYGTDIADLLLNIGFKTSEIVSPKFTNFWGIKRDVVVAQK